MSRLDEFYCYINCGWPSADAMAKILQKERLSVLEKLEATVAVAANQAHYLCHNEIGANDKMSGWYDALRLIRDAIEQEKK